jgi:hypothetical protein
MGCLPNSGRCERQRTEPFVQYLNDIENISYRHEACLDLIIRNRPQPEVLYVEPSTAQRMVIERKTLVWPIDYAERHQADHFLADHIMDELRELTADAPYGLTLQSGISIDRKKLREVAQAIVTQITAHIATLRPGDILRSAHPDLPWEFYLDVSGERSDFAPQKGLIIRWPQSTGLLHNPDRLPTRLESEIIKCFQSCTRKFSEYTNDRRVLLLDPYDDMKYLGLWWWEGVLTRIFPPQEISEIWLAIYGWLTDWEEGWIFQKLYPPAKDDPRANPYTL